MDDDGFVTMFAAEVAALPGVEAVMLGGSRATGRHQDSSDWDFAFYYRGTFDPACLRGRWPGEVSDVGGWGGGVFNGGAWLTVDDRKVDLHYRDLDDLDLRWEQAQRGEFAKQLLLFHVAGVPTYHPVAEVASGRVLVGQLPHVHFPDALAEAATQRWHVDAVFSLGYAYAAVLAGDEAVALANLARGLIEEAHSRLAARREWLLNEKRAAERAGLADLARRAAGGELPAAIEQARDAIGHWEH